MATVAVYVYPYKKQDGTRRVGIRITHKRAVEYLPLEIYVTDKEITDKLKLKKTFYNANLNSQIENYRKRIADIGININSYNVTELKEYLLKLDGIGEYGIDFIAYIEGILAKLEKDKGKKNGTYYQYSAALKWLKEFNGSDKLYITSFTKKYLKNFDDYLIDKKLGDGGRSSYLRGLRTLYYRLMDEYNDDEKDEVIIKHNPFKKFEIVEHVAEKRNLSIEKIAQLYSSVPVTKVEALGKDMFFLTFFFAGIAPIDLYLLKEPVNNRIEFYRDKVKHHKKKIKINILVHPEAFEIIDKYSSKGFLSDIKESYASEKNFAQSCGDGLKLMAKRMKWSEAENLSLYWARHSFSSLATDLDFDTSLIDFALGHVPENFEMAEVYISRHPDKVDNLIRTLIDTVKMMS